jgi:hypothetical protein
MISRRPLTAAELEEMDRIYREGGLRQMASPHVHYGQPGCPHGCGHRLEWIDFEEVSSRLTLAWWDGTGFAGRCPTCKGWVHFTTLGMEAIDDAKAAKLPQLPDNWAAVAAFA